MVDNDLLETLALEFTGLQLMSEYIKKTKLKLTVTSNNHRLKYIQLTETYKCLLRIIEKKN